MECRLQPSGMFVEFSVENEWIWHDEAKEKRRLLKDFGLKDDYYQQNMKIDQLLQERPRLKRLWNQIHEAELLDTESADTPSYSQNRIPPEVNLMEIIEKKLSYAISKVAK